MTGRWFVDANVLVYSRDESEPSKRPLALTWLHELWAERCGCTSIQALSEYYVTVTRKLKPGMPAESAWALVDRLLAWRPAALDEAMVVRARAVEDRYGLHWWDCLIVAAAQGQSCDYLLTEDLQDGQVFDRVQVVDPFAHRPEAFAARPR